MSLGARTATFAWLITAVYYFYQYALRSAPAVMMPQLSEAFGLSAMGAASMVGLFYYGSQQVQTVFGNGYRCVGSPVFRLPITAANVFGDTIYQLNFPTLPGQISGGQVWNFQLWYRNPAGGGCRTPPMSPWPSPMMSMKAWRSSASAIASRTSRLSNGAIERLMSRWRLRKSSERRHAR